MRDARPGERLTTLDGVERVLQPADMLICSGDVAVAIACVMGGEATKVDPDTRDLLLVRRALGHQSIGSTLRYAAAGDDDLRAAIAQA